MQKKIILILSLFLSSQLFCPQEEMVEERPTLDGRIDPAPKPRNWWQKIVDFLRKPKNPRNPSQKRDPKPSSSTNSQNTLLISEPAQGENNSLSTKEKEKLLQELSDEVSKHHSNQGEDSNNPKLTQEQITRRLQQEKELKAIVTTSEKVEQLFKDQPPMTDEVNKLYEQFKQKRLELVKTIIHEKPNAEELSKLKEAFNKALEDLLVEAFEPIKNLQEALSKGNNGYMEQFESELLNSNFVQISDTSKETQNLYKEFTEAFNQAFVASRTATSALKTTEFFITLEKAKEALLKGIQKSDRSITANENWIKLQNFREKLATVKSKAEKLLKRYNKLTGKKGKKAPNEHIEKALNELISLNPNVTLEKKLNLLGITEPLDIWGRPVNELTFDSIKLLKREIDSLLNKTSVEKMKKEQTAQEEQREQILRDQKQARYRNIITSSDVFSPEQIDIIMSKVSFNDPMDPIVLKFKADAIDQTNELTPEQKSIINEWIYKEFIRSGMGLENHDQIKTDQINPDQIRDFVKDFSDGRGNVQKNTFLQIFKDITLINKACNANSIPFQISFIPKPPNESEA